MPCPHHSVTRSTQERARPPNEAQRTQAQQAELEAALEQGPYQDILVGIAGGTALGGLISLAALPVVIAGIRKRFSRHDTDLQERFAEMAYEGAEQARATTVRRHSLDTSPLFADGDGLAEAPMSDPVKRELRQAARTDYDHVKRRLARDIGEAVYEASEQGLEREEIRDRLSNTFDRNNAYEVARVADAEFSTGVGRGQLAALEDAPSVDGKEWRDQRDTRVRISHRAMHGTTVPLGEDFIVGPKQAPARYPGDWRLPVEERLGCRCYLTLA